MGAIDAACRVYSEAIAHHPENPIGHVNLANLLLRANRHAEARAHYEAVLRIDPEHAPAHQGLGAVLSDLGDRAAARHHFEKGFRGHAVSTLPYRGSRAAGRPAATGLLGRRQHPDRAVSGRPRLSDIRHRHGLSRSESPLPPHRLIFNAIGDADLCQPALKAAARLVARTSAPVINDPRAVMKTGRIDNARRLRALPGVVTPRTLAMARHILAGPDGAGSIANHGLAFPLLLRSPGYHTGRNFILVEAAAGLSAAAAGLPGDDLLVIEYLDARGEDGNARKYRVMMIDGPIYPLHLAISANWKVHYFTSDMADQPEYRREEADFLADMPAALGEQGDGGARTDTRRLGLDYAGIDFGLGPDGDLLLFEANATMVIAPPGADERWAYRRARSTKFAMPSSP